MAYDPDRHHRRSIRLKGYDYAQAGAYFVTICTKDRACLFGEVMTDQAILSPAGEIVAACWRSVPSWFPGVAVDAFVVMPNHTHGIVIIRDGGRRGEASAEHGVQSAKGFRADASPLHRPAGTTPRSLSAVVQNLKSVSARRIHSLGRDLPVWQRNYYEHIIRNEDALNRIRQYIEDNPSNWTRDPENPEAAREA